MATGYRCFFMRPLLRRTTRLSVEMAFLIAHSPWTTRGRAGTAQPGPVSTCISCAGAPLTEKKDPISILIVDDHPVMRDGLRAILGREPDMNVIGEAGNGRVAIEQFRKLRPDITLIDLQMPEVDGLQAITAIRNEFPDATIVVLTTYPGDARVARAFTLGATSYLLKTAESVEIINAIRSAMIGRNVIAPEVAKQVARHTGDEALTEREITVLRWVARGRSNRQIAETLHISEDTVKARMKSIAGKLGADDRTHAVMIAMLRGFLDTTE